MSQYIQTTLMWIKNNVREIDQNKERMITYLRDNGFESHIFKEYTLNELIYLCEQTIKSKAGKK